MTQHTEGPWGIDEFPLDPDCVASIANDWAGITTPRDEDGNYEHVAYCHPDNAPIIAAAPSMVDLLYRNLSAWEDEEASVQEEHDDLITELREFLEGLT